SEDVSCLYRAYHRHAATRTARIVEDRRGSRRPSLKESRSSWSWSGSWRRTRRSTTRVAGLAHPNGRHRHSVSRSSLSRSTASRRLKGRAPQRDLDGDGSRLLGPTVRPEGDADREHPDEEDEKADEDDCERE